MLLDCILTILLSIHLAHIREKKYNSWNKKNVSTKSSSESNYINRNRVRNVLRQEHYKFEKIYKKCASSYESCNILKIQKYQARLQSLKSHLLNRKSQCREAQQNLKDGVPAPLFDSEDDGDDGGSIHTSISPLKKDVSSRQLRQLKAIIKNQLFDKIPSNPSYVDQLQPEELPVCELIIQSLKSYIPKKKYYSILAHQLPFVILANDILKYTGYDKFCMNVCPLPTASTINAMRLDAPSLYHLLSRSDPAKFQILDFDNHLIDSEDQARRH
ncbi:hypothetical protein RMATCC62417_11935 [Rhizopus microsporus]|nr:hypothetical protein RMATCC62417_11935 [Rhizopus microsporus]